MDFLVDEANKNFNEQQTWSREQHEKDPLPWVNEGRALTFVVRPNEPLWEFVKACWPRASLRHLKEGWPANPELRFEKVCCLWVMGAEGPLVLRVTYTGLVERGDNGVSAEQPPAIYLHQQTAERLWQRAVADSSSPPAAAKQERGPAAFIDVDPNMRGGLPVVRGTRFPLARVLAELAEGRTLHELAADMDLDGETVREVLRALADDFNRRAAAPVQDTEKKEGVHDSG